MAEGLKKRSKTVKINVGEFPTVDLMPASRLEEIAKKAAKASWTARVISATVIMALIGAGSFGFKYWNQMLYDQQVSQKTAIESRIAELADVDKALSIQIQINENIKNSTLAQINWVELLQRVQSNLPETSGLTDFGVLAGGYQEGEPAVGIQMTIASPEPISYSQMLIALEGVPGFVGPLLLGNITTTNAPGPAGPDGEPGPDVFVYSYPLSFSVDISILLSAQQTPSNPDGDEAPSEAPGDEQEPATEGQEGLAPEATPTPLPTNPSETATEGESP